MSFVANPFNTLYLTEAVGEVDIPAIFSPVLVAHVEPLYQPGNVVLRGMQGTGKTMLLSLLDTRVRLAFWSQPEVSYDGIPTSDPLPSALRRFIGAGINLSSSKAFKLNEIQVSNDRQTNIKMSRAYFADFVNSWVVRDLLQSIETLITELTKRGSYERLEELGLTADHRKLDLAVRLLANTSEGEFIRGQRTAVSARNELKNRIEAYLQLVRDPETKLIKKIDKTRRGLGEPIAATTLALREAGVIGQDTFVAVTIDQFEQLIRRAPNDGDEQKNYRFIHEVEDLLSHRVPHVSYRVGTRPNAVIKNADVVRDFVLVDLDSVLQQKEHSQRLFHRFAEDAFRRRIKKSGIPRSADIIKSKSPLNLVFGKSPTFVEQGRACASKKPSQVVKIEKTWPEGVKSALLALAKQDPVAGALGEAWIRQQWAKKAIVDVSDWEAMEKLPWELPEKRWWKKERLPLAALQVAAMNRQRLIYFGESDIVQLSGENIVAFICICRSIWDCDARYEASKGKSLRVSNGKFFEDLRQTEGIREASRLWHDKMKEYAQGDSLRTLLDKLGGELHRRLIEDRQMSYPGANGISLAVSELDQDVAVMQLLSDATAECFLLQRDHTPKSLSRGKSLKWYPHPILCPFYQLTVSHTKEPLYLKVSELREWLEPIGLLAPLEVKASTEAKRGRTTRGKSRQTLKQMTLFPEDE